MRTKEFERAIVKVVMEHPFFRKLLLETVFEEELNIPTACVYGDGRFKVNPNWFKELSEFDRVFVILHEILHIALCHFTRLGQRERFLWNIATDLAINSMLLKMGFKIDRLKENSLFPERFGFKECLSAEEYYRLLLKNFAYFYPQGFDDHYFCDSRNAQETEEKYRRILIDAWNEAKLKGDFPEWLEELIDELREPKINWRIMLAKFLIQNVRIKTDWTRPNRRYLAYDIIYPTRRQKILKLVVAVDTSGSITSSDLKDFFSEINGILNSFNFYHIYLVQNDVKIQKVEEIKYPDKLPEVIEITGRGGTDFRPVFKYLEEKRIILPLVFFTDLMGNFPEKAPPFPVLWITKEKKEAPFGITVRYKKEKEFNGL
ncbi:MAG: VWA-like domain-containing protein [candidate division WOR-3 bacterium]